MASTIRIVAVLFISVNILSSIAVSEANQKVKKIHAPRYSSKLDLVSGVGEAYGKRWKRDTEDTVDAVVSQIDRLLSIGLYQRARQQAVINHQSSFDTSQRASSQATQQYPVQLVGGATDYEGRVEVQYEGHWFMVCDDKWDIMDATVVCSQLGFGGAVEAIQAGAARFGVNNNGFAMDDVACEGTESALSDCVFRGWGIHNCVKGEEVAGVTCQAPGGAAQQYPIQLVGGATEYEGRVEVQYDGNWFMVCDDKWDIMDATVVCSQLGFGAAVEAIQAGAERFGVNNNGFAMDDVQCAGTEAALSECAFSGWGINNCVKGEEVAGVTCQAPQPQVPGRGRTEFTECFTDVKGADYRGTVSRTQSGFVCQNWIAQTPHLPTYTPAQYPELLGNHNYCRNPSGHSGPWCYTTNPRVLREYCNVGSPQANCNTHGRSTPTQETPSNTNYLSNYAMNSGALIAANNRMTFTGVTSPELCAEKCHSERSFVCRSFEYGVETGQCFLAEVNSRDQDLTFPTNLNIDYYERIDIGPISVFDMTPNAAMPGNNVEALTAVSLEECAERCLLAPWPCASFDFARSANRCWLSNRGPDQVPIRNDFQDSPYDFFARTGTIGPNCYTGIGTDYRGFSFTTEQGHQCANWIAAASDNVGVTPTLYPDGDIGNHNFCRNPDSDRRPWCYYRDAGSATVTGWMYCNISLCDATTTTFGPARPNPATISPVRPTLPPQLATQEPAIPVPVSRGRPAFQSTTMTTEGVTGFASLAVDGNPNPDYTQGSCSRTEHQRNSWWYVDLGANYDVSQIVIVNKDPQGDRLRGASITVGSSPTDAASRTLCGRITRVDTSEASLTPHKRIGLECPTPISGRYVHIMLPRKDYLALCEVEVYGTPSVPEPTQNCAADQFECTSGRNECIPDRLQCNGERDCADGSDENGCPIPLDDFREMPGQYLPNREPSAVLMQKTAEECARFCIGGMNFVCRSFDYVEADRTCNLYNVSRSQNGRLLGRTGVTHYERISQTIDCTNANGIEYHPCPSGRCIPNSWLCDGDNDCGDYTDESNCGATDPFEVRLVNGTAANEGRVEVKYRGRWGLVCDDEWDVNDGHVVCRQLGYTRGASRVYTVGEFGHGPLVDILMDDVQCTGRETSLEDCSFPGWSINNCVVGEAAGVLCKLNEDCSASQHQCDNLQCIPANQVCNGVNDCQDNSDEINCLPEVSNLPVRLVGGNGPTSGRVEVFHNDQWGTVCDDYFSVEAAQVVCNQLNLSGDVRVYPQASFGEGTGQIWLDDVTCNGTESSLGECINPSNYGRHNCMHSEDVGVECGLETLPCGVRGIENSNIMARIIGGNSAKRGNWPWQAQLILKGSGHYCGGTLIDHQHILTAAHCFQRYGKKSFKVRLGEHNQKTDEQSEQEYNIQCLYKHPHYNKQTTNNDIAILRLERPVNINNFVTPACLPTEGEFADGHQCWISGWGNTGDSYPDILQEARVPLLPRSTCSRYNVYGNKLTRQMLCAGFLEGGIDSCDGDSGGPLVCEKNSIWKVVGVTSWGYGCAEPNAPGVYAVVSEFLPWINQITMTRTCT